MGGETLTYQQETEPKLSPFDHLVRLCQENNLPLNAEHIAWLVPDISIRDLKNHEVGKEFGVEPAAVLTDDELLLDPKVESWSPERQSYFMGHEFGHCIAGYLETTSPEEWAQLISLVGKLPVSESSHYISYLDKKLPDDHREEKMAGEKLAELITQFLNGGGTFAGMISTKLLTFPDLPITNEGGYRQLLEHAQEFESRLNAIGVDGDPTDLLLQCPKLAPHYEAWKAIRDLLNDDETFASLEAAISGPEERIRYLGEDMLIDYPEMIEHIPDPVPVVPEVKGTTDNPPLKKPFSFLKFWQIYGD
ncbi:MAG: hypothetical protein Q7K33_03645 [Candidatus Berkelbacteria bacterium]|nr:hypothetical protein [Candidatus Berkelbacteria bacterium]